MKFHVGFVCIKLHLLQVGTFTTVMASKPTLWSTLRVKSLIQVSLILFLLWLLLLFPCTAF